MNRISVITICFNNLSDLQRTCDSVDMQSVLPDEHWIINGSTAPAIADWLITVPQPAYRKWLNEPDAGIADAFNKGINKAEYEITHLLHAGDCYACANSILSVQQYFEKYPDTMWTSGNIQIVRGGEIVVVGKAFNASKLYKGMRSVAHPTWFVKRAVYDRVGFFDLNIKIAMDYDLMCRIAHEPYGYINQTITIFDNTGISTRDYPNSLKENITIYEKYNGYSLKCRIWQFRLLMLYILLNTSLGKWMFRQKKRLGWQNI
ncbi:MAG: hypothetical protein EAZ13_00945 [Sphingobacteriia bacterium]|nr:MAG: hypothetical protein EAZ41_10635 [Sphingobacteriia bacterium]TAG32128.1 MAG: hypothetical protein EAZ35_00730 [Sphingobacteriia bacterium]TAH09341.1 MAG: hypothetical protein EAZ13_00945 [Sphingobacteriia bacterium]